jgi:dihydrofolate reductase
MRKVIYSVGVSLDLYIASADGSVDWLNRVTSKAEAKGEDFGMSAFFNSIDTVLMGRKTYQHALKMGMAKGGYPGMKNYIFSRTLPPGQRDGVEFISSGMEDLIAKLKKSPGKDIWLTGGGELAREALKAKLVDEVKLGVTPILIGDGLPAFPPGFPETDLELVECTQYKGGILGLTYRLTTSKSSVKTKSKVANTRRVSARRSK